MEELYIQVEEIAYIIKKSGRNQKKRQLLLMGGKREQEKVKEYWQLLKLQTSCCDDRSCVPFSKGLNKKKYLIRNT